MIVLGIIGVILNNLGMLNGWMLFWYIVAWVCKGMSLVFSLFKYYLLKKGSEK